jgi:hypothetical protein
MRLIEDAPRFPVSAEVDLAFIPNALGRPKSEFFPILNPSILRMGHDVYTFGHFTRGGLSEIEQGYFGGKIVNFVKPQSPLIATLTLPFPAIEGLSGSPVLTYHNGPKLVGVIIGNSISRILASEIFSYKDEKVEFKETINRIIEHGVAYHCSAVIGFLEREKADIIVSDQRVQIDGLET